MYCKVNQKEQEGERKIVKRRFIPLTFTVDYEGQFLNAAAKLPFTSNKVIGVLTCSKVNPCNDSPQIPRYYFGITDERMVDNRFLEDTNGIEYTTTYPPVLNLQPVEDRYWYYVHPVGDLLPSVTYNDVLQNIGEPIPIAIKKQGQCEAEPHYLWSAKFPDVDSVVIGFFRPA